MSFIFDKYMTASYSNFFGVFIAMFVNFIMQQYIFIGNITTTTDAFFIKYLLADVIIIGSNQLLFNYCIRNKKKLSKYLPDDYIKYYNSIFQNINKYNNMVCFFISITSFLGLY